MLVELLLVEPGRSVDAAQHRVLGVPAPVGARHAGQLERARVELAGRGEVRTAAEIDPVGLALTIAPGLVHGDRLALGQLHHPFGLEGLAMVDEELADPGAVPDFADQRFVGGDDAPHLLLDRRQVLVRERTPLRGRREVVVEAVFGRRAEGDLRSREDVLHRLGEDVREVVADELQRILLVARGNQREVRIPLERAHDVAHLAVHLGGERGLGEARPDRGGDVRGRRPLGHLLHRTVGKRDLEHLGHCTAHVARQGKPLNLDKSARKAAHSAAWGHGWHMALAAAVQAAAGSEAKSPTSLFAQDQPIRATLRGPISAVASTPASSRAARPAVLELASRRGKPCDPAVAARSDPPQEGDVHLPAAPRRIHRQAGEDVAVRQAETAEARHPLPQLDRPPAARPARICRLPDAQRADAHGTSGEARRRSIMPTPAGA